MIIEQALHGYNKGHGLLASSFPMKPTEDSSLMAYLSDWTGYRDESEEDSYMTFYPLEQGRKYAFAKTWYASEMERPGCVWTHTLIVDLDDMDRNFDFRVLKDYFHRPQIDDYEEYSKKIEINEYSKRSSHDVFANFDGTSILFLLLFVLSKSNKLVVYMEREQKLYVDLCFYILQYLPIEILRTVAFSTGSSSYRKIRDKDFTIQFTNNPTSLSLENASWKEKLNVDSFDEGLRYIYEESQKDNDQLPSLIKLFSEDISDQKEKYYAFAMLMKSMDLAIEGIEKNEYTEVLHLLEDYFPTKKEGDLLKYNFMSQKISNLFGEEKDILYQIAAFDSGDFLNQSYVKYGSRIVSLENENHSDFIVLIDKIAKLKEYNSFAVEALEYSIDTILEQELFDFISNNWEHLYGLLGNNKGFLNSGMWLKLPTNHFQAMLSIYSDKGFGEFDLWKTLLNKMLISGTPANKDVASKIIDNVENAVELILNAANSDNYVSIAPSLIQIVLLKSDDILEWLERQNTLNRRVETFIIGNINPASVEVKWHLSTIWNALRNIDDNKKDIEYYVFLYVLAHNWKDKIAVLLLKQSFTHIYEELSNNSIDSRLWSKIEGYTKKSNKIEKWDKCKILSYGLVDYLKKCDFSVEELHQFSAKAQINERLIHIWEKI